MATVTEPQSASRGSDPGSPDPAYPPSPSRFTFHVSRFTFHALAGFAATRLVVFLAAGMGVSQLVRTDPSYSKGPFVEAALMWDAAWYMGIAQGGYQIPVTGTSNLAFPPLLPLLVRVLGDGLHALGLDAGDPRYGAWALAGVLISNLAFLAALILLGQLVRMDHPAEVADRTMWLVAAFPLGVFWSAFYTESLFLLLAVGSVLAARRGVWPLAGALGGLAVLTKWLGVVLLAVLLVEWWTTRAARRVPSGATGEAARPARPAWPALGWIALIPLALAGYLLYLQAMFSTPWGIFQSQTQGWRHGLSFFATTYAEGVSLLWQSVTQTGPDRSLVLHWGSGNSLYMWLDLGLPVLFLALGALGWRRGWLRPGDLTWLGLGLLFPLSLGTTLSLARYLMPLWPALIVGARLCARYPTLERAWLVVSTGLLALGAYIYANAKWIG
jgi:hypothetical protein